MSSFQVSSLRAAVDKMKTDEIRAFDVDPSKSETCPLQQKTYYVRKEPCDHSRKYCDDAEDCIGYLGNVYFYAALEQKFEKSRDTGGYKKGVHNTIINRYETQLGFIKCRKGYIEKVWVNSEKEENPARGCGIAPVFTSLCMVDPELNFLADDAELGDFFHGKYATEYVRAIKKDCRTFMGLFMVADPLTGAYAYFSAAIKSGYKKMLIFDFGDLKPVWMYIEDAKKEYDASTGMIGKTMAKSNDWWFCNEFEG